MSRALIVGDDDQEIRRLVVAAAPILGDAADYLAIEVDPSSTDPSLAWGTARPVIHRLELGDDGRATAPVAGPADASPASGTMAQSLSEDGDTSTAVIDAARHLGIDVIVVAARQQGRLAKFLSGSAADDLVRKSPIPVLTVNLREQDPPP